METTQNNLDTFKILFIIKGILTMLFSLLPIFYIFLGSFIFARHSYDQGPQMVGSIMVIIGVLVFLFIITIGILSLLAGVYLGKRTHYTFIFIIAILNCFTGILGIVLGIFTLIELNKPQVKSQFEKHA